MPKVKVRFNSLKARGEGQPLTDWLCWEPVPQFCRLPPSARLSTRDSLLSTACHVGRSSRFSSGCNRKAPLFAVGGAPRLA